MNLESLLDEVMDNARSAPNDKEERERLKEILCKAFLQQVDDVDDVLWKYRNEWAKTHVTLFGAETPLIDRVLKFILDMTHNDLMKMKEAHEKNMGIDHD